MVVLITAAAPALFNYRRLQKPIFEILEQVNLRLHGYLMTVCFNNCNFTCAFLQRCQFEPEGRSGSNSKDLRVEYRDEQRGPIGANWRTAQGAA